MDSSIYHKVGVLLTFLNKLYFKATFETLIIKFKSKWLGGRKKKKIVFTMFVLLIFIVSGCNSADLKVSEEQAKSSVIEHHTGHIGKVKIRSIELKKNNYIIEWENEENCEQGIDSVDGENGEIEMITDSIC